jgi:hypothetical protein
MKPTRTILLLLLGAVLGIAATLGVQHLRRLQAIRALLSLADRSQPPAIDELPGVVLSRHDGGLHYVVHTGMGGRLKDFEALLAEDRVLEITGPIWSIDFEPGVTMDDLDATIQKLTKLGVERYFIGSFVYGKSVLR